FHQHRVALAVRLPAEGGRVGFTGLLRFRVFAPTHIALEEGSQAPQRLALRLEGVEVSGLGPGGEGKQQQDRKQTGEMHGVEILVQRGGSRSEERRVGTAGGAAGGGAPWRVRKGGGGGR